ncbi:MAG: hypothetical protein O2873_08895 [Proteobacteria bacterium]|nr:hypothetical protein [Pseudomonadota bacterium]
MADLDAALVQKILDIPERQRKPDIQHHRQADDFGAGLEVLEWGASGHAMTLSRALEAKVSQIACKHAEVCIRMVRVDPVDAFGKAAVGVQSVRGVALVDKVKVTENKKFEHGVAS